MKRPHHPEIRAVLRLHPDGLTTNDVAELCERVSGAEVARRSLESMPDAYIDRWVAKRGARGQWQAVWCVVVPPPHCPYPTERFKPETRWVDNSYRRNRTLYDREQRVPQNET